MQNRDYKDIIGGGLIILTGAFVAYYAFAHFRLGVIGRMGPGMFPAAVGVIMCGLGLAIMVPAFFRTGALPEFELRPFVLILVAILVFALTIRHLGMVPSILLASLTASFSDSHFRLGVALTTAVFLSISIYLIFGLALGIQVPIVAWQW